MEKSFCMELILISMLTEVCDMVLPSFNIGIRLDHLIIYIFERVCGLACYVIH